MLIDCGMHHNTKDKKEKLRNVAEDLFEATGGGIHLLVVTHEHTDHIDGFKHANSIFQDIEIENLWLGWTENYEDPEVKKLDKIRFTYLHALNLVIQKLGDEKPAFTSQLKNLLLFNVDEGHDFLNGFHSRQYDPVQEPPKTNRETMTWLKHHCSTLRYCSPGGEPLECNGIDGVKFYVLGPPAVDQIDKLKKSSPSRGTKKETYISDKKHDLCLAFAQDVIASEDSSNLSLFSREAEALDGRLLFPEKFTLGPNSGMEKYYQRKKDNWRRIDDEWFAMASELAIKLDSHTNNSSLVLAIELGNKGKVLLFPGDAQVGNWLSWKDLSWGEEEEEVKRNDLLERVILYKVGHHGSHNATLKEEGLELMRNGELVSMVPVNRNFAVSQGWESIPYPGLMERLSEKCKNRVLYSDEELPDRRPYNMSDEDWQSFLNSVARESNEMYTELTIPI